MYPTHISSTVKNGTGTLALKSLVVFLVTGAKFTHEERSKGKTYRTVC